MGAKYGKIDYPLNEIENLINFGNNDCTNFRDSNHSNIEIIYEQKGSDIPSIYRCPVCLSIPIFYYTQEKILYQCNCGIYNCSINYFLKSFISYPISDIILKDNTDQKEKIKTKIGFCSICSLFVDSTNHSKEYFGHTIKDTDNIFLNEFKYNKKKEIDNEQFREFIKNNLKFDIIKQIEEKYKDFKNIFNKNKSTDSNNFEILNQKLYLLSKFLYYSFQTCLSKNVLNYRILTNLCCNYYQIFRLKEFEKNKNQFNINENHFLDDYEKIIEKNRKSKISSNNIEYSSNECSYGDIIRFFYDKYSQRYLISYSWKIIITEKNNYSEISIGIDDIEKYSIIYFECLKKNVIAIKDSTDIVLLDFEKAKIIKKISLPSDIESKDEINFIEIINNNYLVVGCSNTKLIIYTILQDDSNPDSLNFEFINKISGNYQDIFKVKDTLIFRDNEYLIFNKFNEINNNIEEQFKVEFKSNYHIEINDIENDQILVKQFNTATCLIYIFEIYNLKTQQKICEYECEKNKDNDFLYLEGDYLLRVYRNGLSLFSINNLKVCDYIELPYADNKKKWAVFKDDSGLNIIYNSKLYRVKEEEIKFIADIKYKNKYVSIVDIQESFIW